MKERLRKMVQSKTDHLWVNFNEVPAFVKNLDELIQKRKEKEQKALSAKVEWGFVDHVKENREEVSMNVRLRSL